MLLVSHNTSTNEATTMTDATSPCPPEVSSEVLSGSAEVLFVLEHQFRVLHAQRSAAEAIKVLVELTASEGPCPACWVLTMSIIHISSFRRSD